MSLRTDDTSMTSRTVCASSATAVEPFATMVSGGNVAATEGARRLAIGKVGMRAERVG